MEDQTGVGDALALINARQNGGTSNIVSESHEADVQTRLVTSFPRLLHHWIGAE